MAGCGARGEVGRVAVTWKLPVEEQQADVLLFGRVSSTGTMSCLYPLHHPSLFASERVC